MTAAATYKVVVVPSSKLYNYRLISTEQHLLPYIMLVITVVPSTNNLAYFSKNNN